MTTDNEKARGVSPETIQRYDLTDPDNPVVKAPFVRLRDHVDARASDKAEIERLEQLRDADAATEEALRLDLAALTEKIEGAVKDIEADAASANRQAENTDQMFKAGFRREAKALEAAAKHIHHALSDKGDSGKGCPDCGGTGIAGEVEHVTPRCCGRDGEECCGEPIPEFEIEQVPCDTCSGSGRVEGNEGGCPSEEDRRLVAFYEERSLEQDKTFAGPAVTTCTCHSVGMLDGNRHAYGCPYNARFRLAHARAKEAAQTVDQDGTPFHAESGLPLEGNEPGEEQTEDEGGFRPDLVSAFDLRKAIEETTAELERLRDPRTTWQLYLWDRLFPSGPPSESGLPLEGNEPGEEDLVERVAEWLFYRIMEERAAVAHEGSRFAGLKWESASPRTQMDWRNEAREVLAFLATIGEGDRVYGSTIEGEDA